MTKKKPEDEQRADDQDAAVEDAFVEGTLPEEDRRAPEMPVDAGAGLYKDIAKPRAD